MEQPVDLELARERVSAASSGNAAIMKLFDVAKRAKYKKELPDFMSKEAKEKKAETLLFWYPRVYDALCDRLPTSEIEASQLISETLYDINVEDIKIMLRYHNLLEPELPDAQLSIIFREKDEDFCRFTLFPIQLRPTDLESSVKDGVSFEVKVEVKTLEAVPVKILHAFENLKRVFDKSDEASRKKKRDAHDIISEGGVFSVKLEARKIMLVRKYLIKLSEVEAPDESKQPVFWDKAKTELAQTICNKNLRIDVENVDEDSRYVSMVFSNGVCVQKSLLTSGSVKLCDDHHNVKNFVEFERFARTSGLGQWGRWNERT